MSLSFSRSDSSVDGRELDDLDYEDDPLYDCSLDEKDSEWTAKLRNGRVSDAILSCPCCFTTICIDCQEHTSMIGHFRAVLVMNCRVDPDQKRGFLNTALPRKRAVNSEPGDISTRVVCRKLIEASNADASKIWTEDRNDIYGQQVTESPEGREQEGGSAVFCGVCGTEVAVYDQDKVYHFFNAFPSNA